MNSQYENVKVTGTEASETSVPADVGELATQVVISSSENVSWENGKGKTKFEITEAKIIDLRSQIKWVRDVEEDKYWPIPNKTSGTNRGKLIKELENVNFSLVNLDTCPKAEPPKDLESVKNIIKKAISDLDSIAVGGLADRNRSIYDQTLAVKLSLEIAQANLSEDSQDELSEDEQMRILRSPVNSPTGPQLTIIRQDSQSSATSVTSITNMVPCNLDSLVGPSGTQKRQNRTGNKSRRRC